jgi:subtilisin-like proprotein convertase family protein
VLVLQYRTFPVAVGGAFRVGRGSLSGRRFWFGRVEAAAKRRATGEPARLPGTPLTAPPKERQMRITKALALGASILALAAGAAFADKQQELDEFAIKPWVIMDLPVLGSGGLADQFEVEPNNTCPGEAYVLGDVYHGGLTPGDQDWIQFTATIGQLITVATDADMGSTTDTYLELWDQACGVMLAFNDDGGPGLFSLIQDFQATYTGTYNVKIRGFSSSTQGLYICIANAVTPAGPPICPVGTYKASKINVNLPISDTIGTTTTPSIKFNPQACVITDLIVDINMEHTWVGDLTITLRHTSDGGVVTTTDLVQRPGVPATTFGCSGDLISDPEAKYFFATRDDLEPMGEFDCPAALPAQCYAVAVENPNGLEAFDGIPVGDGVFELLITDSAAGDDGFIYNWSVHILCEQPIAVEQSSWGGIKASYR